MIDLLNNWMLENIDNFNIIVAVITVIHITSLGILFYISKKFGTPDERTNRIYLKVVSTMFTTQLLMNGLFISWVNSDIEYFRQIFLLFQGAVFLVGSVYSIMLYRKDFE